MVLINQWYATDNKQIIHYGILAAYVHAVIFHALYE